MLLQPQVSAVLLYSIAAAAMLIYLPFVLVAYARASLGYEALSNPRTVFDKLPTYAQRATSAHQNSFEAFMVFSAAALMAYVTDVTSPVAVVAAIAFVVARLLHSVFYILNIPILRSLMFAVSTLSSSTLFFLSIIQANG